MISRLCSLWRRVVSFSEKQGFPIIVTICVGIITATAVMHADTPDSAVSPTPPVNQDVSVAQLLQQTLRNAATATPSPTAVPQQFHPPLEDVSVLCPFDASLLIQSCTTGVHRVHAAVDLSAPRGTPVRAMADGVILAAGNDKLHGAWLLISHNDLEVLYAGMAAAEDYIPGDEADAGAVIGYVGSGIVDDASPEPHLHLETKRNGIPFDPLTLWQSN